MKVTKARAERTNDDTAVMGFVDVLLDDVLEINHIRIVTGQHGLFASMPSWRREDGTWQSFVIPHDEDLRQEILNAAMKAYEEAGDALADG